MRPAVLLLLVPALAGAEETLSKGSPERLAEIAKTHRIEIVAKDPAFPVKLRTGLIEGTRAEVRSLEAYVPLFAEELSLYPPALVKRSKLKAVVLCEKLSFAGREKERAAK